MEFVHNHPSGDPSPSQQDIRLTRDLVEAAKHLKIQVHDQVIIGADGHRSLKAMGLIQSIRLWRRLACGLRPLRCQHSTPPLSRTLPRCPGRELPGLTNGRALQSTRFAIGTIEPSEVLVVLPATEEEIAEITDYVEWQAPDLKVTFCQKIYSESVLSHRHDVWDVHTSKDRWWVITNPTNLYSQEMFPNMDLAVTFHMGLMLRVPRSEKPSISAGQIEPFARAFEGVAAARDALGQAHKVADYQTVGVRCREALLTFTAIAQVAIPWTGNSEQPKKSDFKAWVEYLCSATLSGESNKHRRQLFKTQADAAWTFVSWLTHSTSSNWHDAEAALAASESAISLCTNAATLFIRNVPNECPQCGDHRLTPMRADNPNATGELWERPFCTACEWMGDPVKITDEPTPFITRSGKPDNGECVLPAVPLRKLTRPGEDD